MRWIKKFSLHRRLDQIAFYHRNKYTAASKILLLTLTSATAACGEKTNVNSGFYAHILLKLLEKLDKMYLC